MVYFNTISYSEIEPIYKITIDRSVGEGLLSGSISFGAIFGAIAQKPVMNAFSRK